MLTERQIDTFKTAVDAQFGTDAIADPESATPTPAEPVEPEPTAPIAPSAPTAPDVEPTIDVEVKVSVATVTDEPLAPTAPELPATDIETLLNKMSLADIRKLAKTKRADARGNRVNIAARLKKIVTQADIWDATA